MSVGVARRACGVVWPPVVFGVGVPRCCGSSPCRRSTSSRTSCRRRRAIWPSVRRQLQPHQGRRLRVRAATRWSAWSSGTLLGVAMAFLLMRFRLLDELVTPLAVALNAIPIIVLVSRVQQHVPTTTRDAAPADGHAGRVLHRARQRRQGAAPGRPDPRRADALVRRRRRSQVLRKARIPNAVPYLFTALKIAAPIAVITAFVAEYFGGTQNGLGHRITSNVATRKNAVGVGLRARRLRARSDVLPGLHRYWRASPHTARGGSPGGETT